MEKTGLNGLVYNFCVDCNTTDTNNIVDIHKYLMKQHNIVQMSEFINPMYIILALVLSDIHKYMSGVLMDHWP